MESLVQPLPLVGIGNKKRGGKHFTFYAIGRNNGDGTMSFYECSCLWIYDVPMVRIRVSRSRETFIVKGQAARAHIHSPSVAFIRPIAQSHDTAVSEADERIGNVMLAQQPSNRLKGIAFQESREVKQNTITAKTDITGIAQQEVVDGWLMRNVSAENGDVEEPFGQTIIFLTESEHPHKFLVDDDRMAGCFAVDLRELALRIKAISQQF